MDVSSLVVFHKSKGFVWKRKGAWLIDGIRVFRKAACFGSKVVCICLFARRDREIKIKKRKLLLLGGEK